MLSNYLKYFVSPFLIGTGAGIIMGNLIGGIILGIVIYTPLFIWMEWPEIKAAFNGEANE